jgi:hypothetical protein
MMVHVRAIAATGKVFNDILQVLYPQSLSKNPKLTAGLPVVPPTDA